MKRLRRLWQLLTCGYCYLNYRCPKHGGPLLPSYPGIIEQLAAMPPSAEPLDLPTMLDAMYALKQQRERDPQPEECIGWDVGDDYSAVVFYWLYPDGRIQIFREDFYDERPIYEQWLSKHPLAP